MKKLLLLIAGLAFAAAAAAQQFKWVDKDGKVRYGDTPPPGVKATPLRAPSGPSASSKPAAKGGPLTPAQQEAEFRKRQLEAGKAREKEAAAAEQAQAKKENCENAKAQLQYVESGQRIARTDAKGERYFLDDEQRAAEAARARKAISASCGG
ncbi:MAG TPA: DUF4124 domain-containing protein [Burkholderiales bacterium]|nr:DUF4124 domain-containing protein [Burkholderiales bacterium]